MCLCLAEFGKEVGRVVQGFFQASAQKLKGPKTQTQEIFRENSSIFFQKNSRNRKMLGTFLPFITNISCLCIRFHPKTPKYNVFAVKTQGIFKNSMETQGFFENSRPKQPSKLQKLKISETPLTNGAEKTPKKIPELPSKSLLVKEPSLLVIALWSILNIARLKRTV